MQEFEIYGAATTPLIIGLVELFKRMGFPPKLTPLLSLALGILAAAIYIAPGDPKRFIFHGITLGLSASGLYSGVKHIVQETKASPPGGNKDNNERNGDNHTNDTNRQPPQPG